MRIEDVLGEPSEPRRTIPRLNCEGCEALREGQGCPRCGAGACPGCGVPHTRDRRRCENCYWCGCPEPESVPRLDRYCPECGVRPCPVCHPEQNCCPHCGCIPLRDGVGTGRNWSYNGLGDAQGPPCGTRLYRVSIMRRVLGFEP